MWHHLFYLRIIMYSIVVRKQQAHTLPDILLPRPQIAHYPTPLKKVLFARLLAKFLPLIPVETDTFLSLNRFASMYKLSPRIYNEKYFVLGSQYRL